MLLLAASETRLDDTIADIVSKSTCSDYEEANCARCFDITSEYAPKIGATNTLCYECAADKDYYWVNGDCVPLPDARSINGWGRTCARMR